MPRVVALVGGECTGKSTLAHALGDVLTAAIVPEALRAFTDAHGRAPRQEEQVEIVMAQQNAEAEIIAETALDWVICDPATLMSAVYSRIYYDDDALVAAAIVHAELTYEAIIWCDRDLPWTPDPGQRDGAQWRDGAHEALTEILPRIDIPIFLASGSESDRLAGSLEFLAHIAQIDR
jgi:nicotinamide riboside kinase